VLDERWEGAKFRRIERAFSPPTKGQCCQVKKDRGNLK